MTWRIIVVAAAINLWLPALVRSDEPSIAEIVLNLRKAETTVASLNFCVDAHHESWHRPEDENIAFRLDRSADVSWEIRSDGSIRKEAISRLSNVGDTRTIRKYNQFELSVFGKPRGLARYAIWSIEGSVPRSVRDQSGSSPMGSDNPFYLIGLSKGSSVSETLTRAGAVLIDKTTLEGRAVHVLQTNPSGLAGRGWSFYSQIWVDAERSTLVRRKSYIRNSNSQAWQLDRQISCKQFEECCNGELWLPRHVHTWDYYLSDDGQQVKGGESHFAFGRWQAVPELSDDRFDVSFEFVDSKLNTR